MPDYPLRGFAQLTKFSTFFFLRIFFSCRWLSLFCLFMYFFKWYWGSHSVLTCTRRALYHWAATPAPPHSHQCGMLQDSRFCARLKKEKWFLFLLVLGVEPRALYYWDTSQPFFFWDKRLLNWWGWPRVCSPCASSSWATAVTRLEPLHGVARPLPQHSSIGLSAFLLSW